MVGITAATMADTVADITAAGAADIMAATTRVMATVTVAGAAASAGDLESDSDGAMAGVWAGARIGATRIPDIITIIPIGAIHLRRGQLL